MRGGSRLFSTLLLSGIAVGQIISSTTRNDPEISIGAAAAEETTYRLWQIGEGTFGPRSPLESPKGSVSALDLKAPGKARREYQDGYRLLQKKDYDGAVTHLTAAITIYPNYVAAHSALGSAYLNLKQNEKARAEFSRASELDSHLPSSFVNLACAELALQDYPAAEHSMQQASALAPLDLPVLTALSYGQLMNKDYQAAIGTAGKIHAGKHEGFAKVHLYAAAAWQGLQNVPEAKQELTLFLREDPKATAAAHVAEMLSELENPSPVVEQPSQPEVKVTYSRNAGENPSSQGQVAESLRQLVEASKANADSKEDTPEAASNPAAAPPSTPAAPSTHATDSSVLTLHSSANEVAVFFAATSHRKSVTDLTVENVTIRDNRQAPAQVTGFRNEAELPLRLGIVIDTSASVTGRFRFEQGSAIDFLQKVMAPPKDQAFVIGVSNSVLVVQDFTNEQPLLANAVHQLAPSGGTALWDAVAFAADKLASRVEEHPVARLLVVLSDGQNNSSSMTLEQAIDHAQRKEVFVYTVSTSDDEDSSLSSSLGRRSLQLLAESTGGAAFAPGSIHRLNTSFGDLQRLIRGRYLISYKPAEFKRDGQYRTIDIEAEKDGQKLRIYARKGYFASAPPPPEPEKAPRSSQ